MLHIYNLLKNCISLLPTETSAEEKDESYAMVQKRIEALGKDPLATDKLTVPVDNFMSKLWSHWTNKGLETSALDFLLSQYELPQFLKVPKINPEISEFLEVNALKRDEFLRQSHEVSANSIITTGSLAVILMDNDFEVNEDLRIHLISMVSESLQLQCHLFYEQTQSRRSFLLRSIRDLSFKVLLEKQEADEYLFGTDLASKIKSFKNVKNIAKEIAPPTTKKSAVKNFLSQRSNHPFRNNQPWSGQGLHQNRWIMKNKSQFLNQMMQTPKRYGRNQGQAFQKKGQNQTSN